MATNDDECNDDEFSSTGVVSEVGGPDSELNAQVGASSGGDKVDGEVCTRCLRLKLPPRLCLVIRLSKR